MQRTIMITVSETQIGRLRHAIAIYAEGADERCKQEVAPLERQLADIDAAWAARRRIRTEGCPAPRRRRRAKPHVLNRDIVIPAGTEVRIESARTSQYVGDWASVLIAHSNDSTGEWLMPLDEAVALDLVKPKIVDLDAPETVKPGRLLYARRKACE